MSTLVSRNRAFTVLTVVAITLAGCTGETPPPASGDRAGTSLVIAVPEEPASLHPLAGYAGLGAAKLYDGLLEHQPAGGLRPTLAETLPVPTPDGKSWTITLKRGISFTDGTEFDAQDVVATYRALLDPAFGSPLRQQFWMLAGTVQLDPGTVRFDLTRPYPRFADLLVLGLLPSESLAKPGPVTGNTTDPPPGTGPYRLAEWRRGERLILQANEIHPDGKPAITKVTVEFVPDDEQRAGRLRDGKVDGAPLPPRLAAGFGSTNGVTVVQNRAADVRAVVLPSNQRVTSDPALRLALNHALDRGALLGKALDGKGSPLSTPMPAVLPEFVEPQAVFSHDQAKAASLLDAAGWVRGADGIRERDGVPAAFTVRYPAADTVSKDLVVAFADAVAAIGVKVTPEPAVRAPGPEEPRLIRFGDPFDPDPALYPLLHGTGNADVDAALETARASTDPAQRAVAFRAVQRAYVAAPSMVVLAQPDHLYVTRENWTGYQSIVDGPIVDHTWGAWWNLHRWTPR